MPGLLDIAVATEKVSLGETIIEVRGLDAGAIGDLVREYDELRAYFSGREVNAAELFASAFRAVPAIISAGTGEPADHARKVPLEAQLTLVTAILKATMPRGVGPLVEAFAAMGGVLNAGGVEQPSLN
jgi:hypothetical protein